MNAPNSPPDSGSRPLLATIGRYQVQFLLGKGSWAEVFACLDPVLGRQVAVKLMRDTLSGDVMRNKERFSREIQTLSRLRHPNLLEIYDGGFANGRPFLVAPVCSGPSLDQLLAHSRRMPLAQLIDVVEQIANAVQYVHNEQLVHRDLKPSNLLFHGGVLKLADFGVVRVEQSQLTTPGDAVGTPAFMAPEQVLGETIDHRIDLYALGAMIFLMVTGRLPFVGKTMEVMFQIAHSEPARARSVAPDVSDELDAFLARAMAKSPDQRFQSALELFENFRKVIPAASKQPVQIPAALRSPAVAFSSSSSNPASNGERNSSWSGESPSNAAETTHERSLASPWDYHSGGSRSAGLIEIPSGSDASNGAGKGRVLEFRPFGTESRSLEGAEPSMSSTPPVSRSVDSTATVLATSSDYGEESGKAEIRREARSSAHWWVLGLAALALGAYYYFTQGVGSGGAHELVEIVVKSVPDDATIFLDSGRLLGVAPLTSMVEVAADGQVHIIGKKSGFRNLGPISKPAKAGARIEFELVLEPLGEGEQDPDAGTTASPGENAPSTKAPRTKRVATDAIPKGQEAYLVIDASLEADVFIDGRPAGRTEKRRKIMVGAGSHLVTVRSPDGGTSKSREITLKAGELRKLDYDFHERAWRAQDIRF